MSAAVFVRQVEHFKNSERYTFYAFDPRGQGTSSHTAGGHYYEQRGRDLKALLDVLGLKGVVLAGWSYGGLDASSYLHQFGPGNLKGLVLIDAPPKSSGDDNTKEWVWWRKDDADHAKRDYTMPMLLDHEKAVEDLAKWMVENPTDDYMKWMEDISNQTPATVAALTNETGAYMDFEPDVKALEGKRPLLIVVRAEWEGLAKAWAAKNTPSAQVKALGRHLMFWEHADEFNAILDAYLNQIRS